MQKIMKCFNNIRKQEWKELNLELDPDIIFNVYSHRSVVYKDKIYIFGGCNPTYNNQFLQIDFETMKIKKVDSITTPLKRGGHTLTVHDDKLFAFG